GLFLGQDHHLSGSLCESLEQLRLPLPCLSRFRLRDGGADPRALLSIAYWVVASGDPSRGRMIAGVSSTSSAARCRRIRPPVVVYDEHPVYRRPLVRPHGWAGPPARCGIPRRRPGSAVVACEIDERSIYSGAGRSGPRLRARDSTEGGTA